MTMFNIKITPLTKIADERGAVFHMLRNDDKVFQKFGEIYFSLAYPGVVKGWHRHSEMTLNYAVIQGMIKLVVTDEKDFMEIYTGDLDYKLITIPPGLWNGFKCIGDKPCIVANCATTPYNKDEIETIDPYSDFIDYNWNNKYRL